MTSSHCGIVVVGRNEAAGLATCLESVRSCVPRIVYVDSNSSDASRDIARRLDIDTIALDDSSPLSAARGRNAGWRRLLERFPEIELIQFVDGDVELDPQWLENATRALLERPETAIVYGQLCERFPEASIYNQMCDVEWDGPVGEVQYCGGIFLTRRDAFEQLDGFDERFSAGEEPELCMRLRKRGWRIERLPEAMGRHDAALFRFADWWRRSQRSGQAFAQTAWEYGSRSGRAGLRSVVSVAAWAGALPAVALLAAVPTGGMSLALLLAYPVLWKRIARGIHALGRSEEESRRYAAFIILGKFAQLSGMGRFALAKLFAREP